MAHSLQDQAEKYPLTAYNFRVTVGGSAMRFAKVSGLQHEYQTQTYRDGLSFMDGERIVKYFMDRYIPVTLEQGVLLGDHDLHDWLKSSSPRVVDVQLCNARGAAVLAWRIRRAVAVRLKAPGLDARSNDAAIDTLELMASGISVEDLS